MEKYDLLNSKIKDLEQKYSTEMVEKDKQVNMWVTKYHQQQKPTLKPTSTKSEITPTSNKPCRHCGRRLKPQDQTSICQKCDSTIHQKCVKCKL